MDCLPLMARFNRWVNAHIYDAAARLDDRAYRRDHKAFFGSIHNTLNHLLLVDRLWLCRIEGVEHGLRSLDQILHDSLSALREARQAEDHRLIELVDGLGAARLRGSFRYRPIAGGDQAMRVDHALITLLNHQTHHRGQVHAMLTREGVVPPSLDVIVFLEEAGLANPEPSVLA